MTKTVLITGASNGIGLHLAIYLAQRGYIVYAGVRNLTGRHIPGLNEPGIVPVNLDVTNPGDIKSAVATVIAEHGKIDYMINNAGFAVSGPVESIPVSEFRRQFETNYIGAVAMMQAVAPCMREARSGMIINVSSVVGQMAYPFGGAYSSSKFALEGISTAMRYELAPFGVYVTIVEPGYIRTNFISAMDQVKSPVYDKYEAAFTIKANRIRAALGTTTEATSKAIYRIMNTKKPKLRYPVGLDAAIGLGMKRVLGDEILDRILMGQAGK